MPRHIQARTRSESKSGGSQRCSRPISSQAPPNELSHAGLVTQATSNFPANRRRSPALAPVILLAAGLRISFVISVHPIGNGSELPVVCIARRGSLDRLNSLSDPSRTEGRRQIE